MGFKTNLNYLLSLFLMIFFFCPSFAQVENLHEFKEVKIPWNIKHEDMVIKKGEYDLLFIRQSYGFFHLIIKKKGKTICIISNGERVKYKNQGDFFKLSEDPDIPKNAKLTLKRNPVIKIAYIIFETGKHSQICPFHKIRFKLKYED